MFFMDWFGNSKIRKASSLGSSYSKEILLGYPIFFLIQSKKSAELSWGNACRVRPQVLSQLLQPLHTANPRRCRSTDRSRSKIDTASSRPRFSSRSPFAGTKDTTWSDKDCLQLQQLINLTVSSRRSNLCSNFCAERKSNGKSSIFYKNQSYTHRTGDKWLGESWWIVCLDVLGTREKWTMPHYHNRGLRRNPPETFFTVEIFLISAISDLYPRRGKTRFGRRMSSRRRKASKTPINCGVRDATPTRIKCLRLWITVLHDRQR
jgi:hypothetical protein